jgi:glycosyltransferase involved in cell wall biosynthesis
MTHRMAIVASHVIQYQDPFFRLLAAQPGIDLTVLYCSPAGAVFYQDREMATTLRWDVELLAGYRHQFLPNYAPPSSSGFWRHINPSVVPRLIRGRYDAVIFMHGWGSWTTIAGILACRFARIPFFLYGDSSYPRPEDSMPRRIRAAMLRTLFGMTTGFMVSGKLNADYYAHYGADRARFFLLPWAVDNERFIEGSRFGPGERETMRAAYGIGSDKVVLLFSAKLIERKDPRTLVHAYERMRNRSGAVVVFMGDGALRASLEQYVRDRGLERNILFLGFVNQTDLPKHYAVADVFVLPSLVEPRGAVINEAMACGLPVVVTDRCGSIGDIVLDGENAFIYPAGDADALADLLDRLTADPSLRARMAARSREIIATWDFHRGVEGVKAMLHWLEGGQRA